MITSRALSDLLPPVQELANRFLDACHRAGIQVLVTATYRDFEAQNELYAEGRTAPGKIVTNAKAGDSWHNWRRAFDVVPLRNGKPVWGTTLPADKALWNRLGQIGANVGLEWGGSWTTLKDYPHFQFTGGLTLAQLKQQEHLT